MTSALNHILQAAPATAPPLPCISKSAAPASSLMPNAEICFHFSLSGMSQTSRDVNQVTPLLSSSPPPHLHTYAHFVPHTHTETLGKASETKGAAHSSVEFAEDRMLASRSRNAAMIPAYSLYSQRTLYHHVSASSPEHRMDHCNL